MTSREEMLFEIEQLGQELLKDKARLQKMKALTVENIRLRDLLGSAVRLEDKVYIAELIGVNPDPDKSEILIDKGRSDGVFVYQSVLDAQGLIGQVIEVGSITSRILLISDQRHLVPVQVARNNLRLIVQGTGRTDEVDVLHVQDTADISLGDLLLSSGLAGRFPSGYPVARVISIDHDPGKPFATVRAKPTAFLDRSRHLVLVFPENKETAKNKTSAAGEIR